MRGIVAAVLATACQGEAVSGVTHDSGSDAAASTDVTDARDASDCGSWDGNLLANPSFESWEGATPTGWAGPITRSTNPAHHCATAAVVTSKSYEGAKQQVRFGSPPAGKQLELWIATRYISGAIDAPKFNLYFSDADNKPIGGLVIAPIGAWRADGVWSASAATVTLPANASQITFHVLSQVPVPQTFEIDDASMRVLE
jgi:hypothetical protein